MFFFELAHKGTNNPIYNYLPDIIGRLSHNIDVSPQKFQRIVKFLMSFIEKDKQISILKLEKAKSDSRCAELNNCENELRSLNLFFEQFISDIRSALKLDFEIELTCRPTIALHYSKLEYELR